MLSKFVMAFALILCISFGATTRASTLAPVEKLIVAANSGTTADLGTDGQLIYYAGPDVTAPVLLPSAVPVSEPKRCAEMNGVVRLSAVVCVDGIPQNIKTIHSDDHRLSSLASQLVGTLRFKPGLYKRVPKPVAIELTIGLQTCAEQKRHKTASDDLALTLHAHPLIAVDLLKRATILPGNTNLADAESPSTATSGFGAPYQVGGRISSPMPIFQPDPALPDFVTKKKRIAGVCMIDAIIDPAGIPRNLHVVKSLEPRYDSEAVETIKTWRFKPGLKDGKVPVPVEVSILAYITRYKKQPFSFATMAAESPGKFLDSAGRMHKPNDITPPEPLPADRLDLSYSYYGRQNRIQGNCFVSFLVDSNGVPQNVHVIKGLELGMDEDAVYAVQQLRFKPAMKDGKTPIPFAVIMPVGFRLSVDKKSLFENLLTAAVFISVL